MSSEPNNNTSSPSDSLTAAQRELIIEYVWRWFWRFTGLAIVIVGSVSSLAVWAFKDRIWSNLPPGTEEEIAKKLNDNPKFVKKVATINDLPIGTILIWWGTNKSKIPEGWALCDGTFPETNWKERTPNLNGRVLVGAETGVIEAVKDNEALLIPEPKRTLQVGGDAKINWGLRGDGVVWAPVDPNLYQGDFFERVKTEIDALPNHEIMIEKENLLRAEVHFIIRYK